MLVETTTPMMAMTMFLTEVSKTGTRRTKKKKKAYLSQTSNSFHRTTEFGRTRRASLSLRKWGNRVMLRQEQLEQVGSLRQKIIASEKVVTVDIAKADRLELPKLPDNAAGFPDWRRTMEANVVAAAPKERLPTSGSLRQAL